MSNMSKSVMYSMSVLAVGLVAIGVAYTQIAPDQGASVSQIEPAAGDMTGADYFEASIEQIEQDFARDFSSMETAAGDMVEETGETTDNAMDATGDALEETADTAGEMADDAVDSTNETINDIDAYLDEATESVEETVEDHMDNMSDEMPSEETAE